MNNTIISAREKAKTAAANGANVINLPCYVAGNAIISDKVL